MRFNSEPFARSYSYRRYQQDKTPAERAEERLQKRLVSPEKLMYNYETGGIEFADSGKLFTGKFAIPADRFERIVKVIDGQEVCNLVRIKNGKNFYIEIIGNNPKYYNTVLSPEEREEQTAKMLEADQRIYDKMVERFTTSRNK